MAVSTVTSKGQVTIPKKVRESLRIATGDRVSFVVKSDGTAELRPETVDLRELYGTLEHEGGPVTVEQMKEDIADAARGARRRARRG